MADYWLTQAAEDDLLEIAEFGIARFGWEQVVRYRDTLKARFEQLAEEPEVYPRVDHVRAGYRRSVCGVHSIYYRQIGGDVEIVRVLGRQDINRSF